MCVVGKKTVNQVVACNQRVATFFKPRHSRLERVALGRLLAAGTAKSRTRFEHL